MLDEEYIPFDFDTDYDDPLYTEYRRIRMLDNPLEDNQPSALNQTIGAIYDLGKNYLDMKDDNTIGADDYFHCKANYEAASRGKYGEKTASAVGDFKERVDYFKNRLLGNNFVSSLADYHHDKNINKQGRFQKSTNLYDNSKNACNYLRVNGINEKY